VITAVLDTNVICSGLLTPAGVPGEIIRRWKAGQFEIVTSEATLSELGRILRSEKIRSRLPMSDFELSEEIAGLGLSKISDPPPLRIDELTDQTDLKFIEAAAVAEADYLVTGDHAVQRLGEYGTTQIVTPRRFLTILEFELAP
jgi:putative PIN family toxin of toxin-antitoxin system